ncbi:MAG TPA: helix-turn-helix transcriptional regulator [Solirubrobacter sp.]
MNDTPQPMLHSLAYICRQRRRERQHTQATIAERAGVSRSAVNEFEATRTWPRDPDRLVRGYADDERDAAQLWQRAVQHHTETIEGTNA